MTEEWGRPYIRVAKPSSRHKYYLSIAVKIKGRRKERLHTIESFGEANEANWLNAIKFLLPCIRTYEEERAKKWLKREVK